MFSLALEKPLIRSLKMVALAGIIALTGACASSQQQDLPEVDKDGLELVKQHDLGAVYVKPGASLKPYDKIILLPFGEYMPLRHLLLRQLHLQHQVR